MKSNLHLFAVLVFASFYFGSSAQNTDAQQSRAPAAAAAYPHEANAAVLAVIDGLRKSVLALGVATHATIDHGGATGASSYTYYIVPSVGKAPVTSAPYGLPTKITTANGNAKLSKTNTNIISAAVPARATLCTFFRTGGGESVGKIATVPVNAGSCSLTDTGLAGDSSDPYSLFAAPPDPPLAADTPLIAGAIYMDGCTNVSSPVYSCSPTGLQQAITDANGHSGVAGVVVIPPTANCPVSTCSQIALELGFTTIEIPSNTYIVGFGKFSSEFDYAGSGCAFDFPAGTQWSGLLGIGLEQENAVNSGVCMEGNYTSQTYDNVISDVFLANNVVQNGYVSGQKGIVITSAPTGGNGTALIRENVFRDVLIFGINQPVVANTSTQNRWDLKIQGVGPSQVAMNLCGESDIVDLAVEDFGTPQTNTVALGIPSATCTNNQVRVVANLVGSGATMINDQGNGDEIHISDTNASGLGVTSPTSLTFYCEPLSPYCMTIQPQITFANLPSSAPNGTTFICNDCTNAARCAAGGTGALAKRIGGVWVCH